MKRSIGAVLSTSTSAVFVLTTALSLSACNKTEQAPAPAPEPTEVTSTEPATPPVPESTPDAAVTEPTATETAAEPATGSDPQAADTAVAATDAPTPELSADAGKALYEKQCQACHAQGLLEAPKFGDKAAWAPRIAKGKETLYEHSAKGFNKMPAQAAGDVSEAEVHAAVDYMVDAAS